MKLHHSVHLVLKSFLTRDFRFSFLKISIRITHDSFNVESDEEFLGFE